MHILNLNETKYIEKKVSLWLLCSVQHSVIMANFTMPETRQPMIVIILIIYTVYILKNVVELYSNIFQVE